MVWWIVGGLVLLGFVVLGLAARPAVARLGPLNHALLKLQRRAEEAQALQAAAEALQAKVAALQEHAERRDHRRS